MHDFLGEPCPQSPATRIGQMSISGTAFELEESAMSARGGQLPRWPVTAGKHPDSSGFVDGIAYPELPVSRRTSVASAASVSSTTTEAIDAADGAMLGLDPLEEHSLGEFCDAGSFVLESFGLVSRDDSGGSGGCGGALHHSASGVAARPRARPSHERYEEEESSGGGGEGGGGGGGMSVAPDSEANEDGCMPPGAAGALEKHDDLLAHFSPEEIFAICASRAMEAHTRSVAKSIGATQPSGGGAGSTQQLRPAASAPGSAPNSVPGSPRPRQRLSSLAALDEHCGGGGQSMSLPSSPLMKRPPAKGTHIPKRRKSHSNLTDGVRGGGSLDDSTTVTEVGRMTSSPLANLHLPPASGGGGSGSSKSGGGSGLSVFVNDDIPSERCLSVDLGSSLAMDGDLQGPDSPASSRKNKLQRCSACGARPARPRPPSRALFSRCR